MIYEERITYILKEIEDHGSVSIVEMSQKLSVSEMTVRRDLTDLEKEGLVKRVHGGAVLARGRSYEPAYMQREMKNRVEKELIGKFAADLIVDGDSIALDIGSTTVAIAHQLVGRQNLTVLTPSLHIANVLANQPGIRLILTGGIVRQGELSLTGALAYKSIEGLFVDRLFLAVGAVDSKAGLTEYNWDDALVKQAMTKNAKEVILVADASKFEKVAFAHVAPLNAIHTLVTEQAPPPTLQKALDEAGVQLLLANNDDPKNNLEE